MYWSTQWYVLVLQRCCCCTCIPSCSSWKKELSSTLEWLVRAMWDASSFFIFVFLGFGKYFIPDCLNVYHILIFFLPTPPSLPQKKRDTKSPNKTSNSAAIIKKKLINLKMNLRQNHGAKNCVFNPKTVCLPLLASNFTWSPLTWREFSAIPLACCMVVFMALPEVLWAQKLFSLILNYFVLVWDITMTLFVDTSMNLIGKQQKWWKRAGTVLQTDDLGQRKEFTHDL